MGNVFLLLYLIPMGVLMLATVVSALVNDEPVTRGEIIVMFGVSCVPIINFIAMMGAVGTFIMSEEVQGWLSKPVRKPSK